MRGRKSEVLPGRTHAMASDYGILAHRKFRGQIMIDFFRVDSLREDKVNFI